MEIGTKNEKLNIAKNLIALGLPTKIIAQGTGLSTEIIDRLRK